MMERDWDNPSFIPLPRQPLRILPAIRRFRRKAPRIPERDVPPTPIRAGIELIPNSPPTMLDQLRAVSGITGEENFK